MKKIIYYLLLITLFVSNQFVFAKKLDNPVLILSSKNLSEINETDNYFEDKSVYNVNERIYFSIYHPKGFKSDFIKYQIVKQDDKAHFGGYTRIRNKTVRLKDRNYYSDYIYLTEAGKYFIQIFDITNLHQWVVIGAFLVKNE